MIRVEDGSNLIASCNGIDVTDRYPKIGRLSIGLERVFGGPRRRNPRVERNGLPDLERLQQRMNRHVLVAGRGDDAGGTLCSTCCGSGNDLTKLLRYAWRVHHLEQFTLTSRGRSPRLDVELTEELIDSFCDAGLEAEIIKATSQSTVGERSGSTFRGEAKFGIVVCTSHAFGNALTATTGQ